MAALFAASAAVAGCGGATASSSSAGPPQLAISSPDVGKTIPAQYTCSGKDISPPMQWGNVPAGAAELALFLLDLGHTEAGAGGTTQVKLKVAWAVRGLSPALRGMAAGRLPPGARAGHARYTICPPKGGTGEYMFRLYALPGRLPVSRRLSDIELFRKVNKATSVAGYFTSAYTRG